MLRDGENLDALPDAASKTTTVESRARASATLSGPETVLCATDFRQRPMLYLSPEEWEEFRRQIPALRKRLAEVQAEIEEADEEGSAMRDYLLRRKYILDKHEGKRIGRMGYGTNFGRSYETGKMGPRARARKIPAVTKV